MPMPDYAALAEAMRKLAEQYGILADSFGLYAKGQPILVLSLTPILAAEAAPAAEQGRGLSPVIGDILTILSESQKPLTGVMILVEMSKRKMQWGRKAVEDHLAALVADGTLILNGPGVKPRGYFVPAAE